MLLSASADGTAVTDMNTWRQVCELSEESAGTITSLLPLLHADIVVSGNDDGVICVWRTTDWKCIRTIRAHDECVHCLCTVGDRLLSGGADATIRLWRAACLDSGDWECESRLYQDAPVTALAAGPSCTGGFFSGLDNGGISTWLLQGAHWEHEVLEMCHEDAVEVILRHNSTVMLSIDCDRLAAWWEYADGIWCLSRRVAPWTGPFYAIALQDKLLSGDADGHIKIWQKIVPGRDGQLGGYAAENTPTMEMLVEESDTESLDWQSGSDVDDFDGGLEDAEDDDMFHGTE